MILHGRADLSTLRSLRAYSPEAMEQTPDRSPCKECRRLERALRAAQRADHRALRTRLRDVAASSGRDFFQFGVRWVFSVATCRTMK